MPESANAKDPLHQVYAELVAIKRLLVLALMERGTTQREIADALQISQSTVSTTFAKPKNTKSTRAASKVPAVGADGTLG